MKIKEFPNDLKKFFNEIEDDHENFSEIYETLERLALRVEIEQDDFLSGFLSGFEFSQSVSHEDKDAYALVLHLEPMDRNQFFIFLVKNEKELRKLITKIKRQLIVKSVIEE